MALEQMTFNLGALEDSLASGKNYVAGQVFEVFNIGGTLATIYSDAAGTSPITQDGIANVSNADGEVNFYILEGVYYFTVNTKRRDFTAGFGGQLINDLSQVYIFDTVALFKASLHEFPDGKIIHLNDRDADFTKITGTSTANTLDIIASTSVNQSIDYIINGFIELRHLVVEDGSDAKTAIERGLVLAPSIFVRNPKIPYLCTGAAIPRNGTLYGDNKFGNYDNALTADGMDFVGDGINPLFTFGDGINSAQRRQTMRGIRGFNDGAPCVIIDNAPEWEISNCLLHADNITDTNSGAIKARFSFRGKLKDNNLACGQGGWAFTAMNNCNAMEVTGNTATGGGAGGAFDIGQCQSVNIASNIIESSLKGIYICSSDNPENGLCSAITIDGSNYLEQVRDPFHIGTKFIVRGGHCVGNRIGNSVISAQAARADSFAIGRIQSFDIKNNIVEPYTTENIYNIIVDSATGDIEENVIARNRVQGLTPASIYTLTGAFGGNASALRRVGAVNHFDFIGSKVSSSDFVEYISPLMQCNVTLAATAYLPAQALILGGEVLSVEILEATGALDGTLRIGRSGSQAETVDADLSLLTIIDGTAVVPIIATSPAISKTENNTIRLTAGVLTTTFRFRIRYRAV